MIKNKHAGRSKRSAHKTTNIVVGGKPRHLTWYSSSLTLLLLFLVTFGGLGSYLLFASHADTTKVPCNSIGNSKYNCRFYEITPVKNGSNSKVGTIHAGTNYIFCQQQGGEVSVGNAHNNWWGYTTSDQNTHGWVNAVYGKGGINDHGYDGVPNCNNAHGVAPLTPAPASIKKAAPSPPAKITPAPSPAKPVAPTPVKPVTPTPAPVKPVVTYSHNPEGIADSCALENGETAIYGWATDTDAPKGSLPMVQVTINRGTTSQLTVSIPSNLTYRESAVTSYVAKYYPGQSTPGIYGWKATVKGLYKNGVYKLSGSIINVGAGATSGLGINASHGVDGTTKPYFISGAIPAACLAPKPTSGAIVKPTAGNGSIAVTTPIATAPVNTPQPTAPSKSTGSKAATPVKKITCTDLKHGKTCSNGQTTCDKGWKPSGKHCEINNAVVVHYNGYNDGCGSNATHYAANKTTHVSQKNYGNDSVCKCNNGKFIAYSKPISDSHSNGKCSAGSSHRGSSSSSSSTSKASSGGSKTTTTQCICAAPGCHISNCKDDGCGAHAERLVPGNLSTKCIPINQVVNTGTECHDIRHGVSCNGVVGCLKPYHITYASTPPSCTNGSDFATVNTSCSGIPYAKRCKNGSATICQQGKPHAVYKGSYETVIGCSKPTPKADPNLCNKHDGFADGCHDPSNHNCGSDGQWHYKGAGGCGCINGWYGAYCQIKDYKPPKPVNKRVTCQNISGGKHCSNGTTTCNTAQGWFVVGNACKHYNNRAL